MTDFSHNSQSLGPDLKLQLEYYVLSFVSACQMLLECSKHGNCRYQGIMSVRVQLFYIEIDAASEWVFGLKFRKLSLRKYFRTSNVLITCTVCLSHSIIIFKLLRN